MAAVTVYAPSAPLTSTVKADPTKKWAWLAADDGTKWIFPWAPVEASLDGAAGRWDEVERVGRTPLVRFKAGSLPSLAFDVMVAHFDGTDVEAQLDTLTKLARSTARVTVGGLSRREEGPWRLVGCGIKVLARTPAHAIAQATVSLSFKAASDVTVAAVTLPTKTGPLTGGVSTAPTVPPTPGPKTYTVRSGDSLWRIAKTFYGDPEKWRTIAAANIATIRNPNVIQPGWVLTIPGV